MLDSPASQAPEEADVYTLSRKNPQNWPETRKWIIVYFIAYVELITPFASASYAPLLPHIRRLFHDATGVPTTISMSIYVLGFVCGPLLLVPASEIYGRARLYRVSLCLFIILTSGCALANSLEALICFRFLSGCAGSAPMALGGGVIADIIDESQRGKAMSLYSLGPIVGIAAGPILGGVVGERSWRWVFWSVALLGAVALPGSFILPETYAPILRVRSGLPRGDIPGKTPTWQDIASIYKTPFQLVVANSSILLLSLVMAATIGILNLMSATLAHLFERTYGFSTRDSGFLFLSGSCGSILASFVASRGSDMLSKRARSRGSAGYQHRLMLAILATPLLIGGMLCYGWALRARCHWSVPATGLFMLGFGISTVQISIATYLVDAFSKKAASVMAAHLVIRSVGGATLPWCGFPLFDRFGPGWGATILGAVLFFSQAVVMLVVLQMRHPDYRRMIGSDTGEPESATERSTLIRAQADD